MHFLAKYRCEDSSIPRNNSRNVGRYTSHPEPDWSGEGSAQCEFNIGNQVWMAENLYYRTSRGSWCYGNQNANCEKYGRLYTWETAKRVCLAGWHLPSDRE